MKTALALGSSVTLALLAGGALCVACGSSASDGSDGSVGNGQSAGAGAAGAAAANGAAGSLGTAGSSAGLAGTSAGGAGLGGAPASGGMPGTSAGAGGTFNTAGAGGSSGGSMSMAGTGGGGVVPTGKTEFAPYYEIGSGTGAFTSLVDMQTKSGVHDVTLAFVLSGGNGCSTDGTVSGDLKDIKAFIAAGGHVKASFGGADGKYVEANCGDATSLAGAYSNFVDATGITDLDFDIEQNSMLTTDMNARRGQALKMVQDSKGIQVSFTLQTDEKGLSSGARACIQGAVTAGVQILHVNLMVMDYGDQPQGTPIAPIAIGSLNGALTQVKKIIPALTDDQAWAMLAACPDIGQNDDNEIFTLADAQTLTDFAIQKKLGLITFWNIQRDQTCGKGECSQNDKANFDFSNIFKKVEN
jgi:hypothetical protein